MSDTAMSNTTKVIIAVVVLLVLYFAYTWTRPVAVTTPAAAPHTPAANNLNNNFSTIPNIIDSASSALDNVIVLAKG